jgi:hypothetical protein
MFSEVLFVVRLYFCKYSCGEGRFWSLPQRVELMAVLWGLDFDELNYIGQPYVITFSGVCMQPSMSDPVLLRLRPAIDD